MNHRLHSPARKVIVLVVGADYIALTSRIDPNVIFWDINLASQEKPIPRDVKYLWVSKHVDKRIKVNLLRQADERKDITTWKCEIGELCKRVYPFWAFPWNRSPLHSVMPDQSGIDEAVYVANIELTSTDHDAFPAVLRGLSSVEKITSEKIYRDSEKTDKELDIENRPGLIKHLTSGRESKRIKKVEGFKKKRLALLKQIGERHQHRVTQTNNTSQVQPVLQDVFQSLTPLERKVYQTKFGIANENRERSISEVASLFLLSEFDVAAIIARVSEKIKETVVEQVEQVEPVQRSENFTPSKFDEISIGEF